MVADVLPDQFWVELQDDAMAPFFLRGFKARFQRSATASPRDFVLVRDAEGHLYFRKMQEKRPGHWSAVALGDGYDPLDSVRDGLVVVGVLVGVDGRWGAGN